MLLAAGGRSAGVSVVSAVEVLGAAILVALLPPLAASCGGAHRIRCWRC